MSHALNSRLATHELGVDVPGRTLVSGLRLDVPAGDFLVILGPNGVGKTLTLMTLAGLRPPAAGRVELDGVDLSGQSRADIATRLALMPQIVDDIFPATVLETALIGRHPHIPGLRWESADDRRIAGEALASVGIAELAARDVLTLSGGERRRLAVAQLLAQDPGVCLVDEPTNHLDLQHQLDVLELFHARVASGGAVVMSLHDVNLAARYATRCLLLHGDGRWEIGPVDEVLTEEKLSELYATPIEAVSWRSRQLFVASGPPRDSSQPT